MRIDSVIHKTTVRKSEIWTRISKNIFPLPLELSKRITVWDENDIELWMRFKKQISLQCIKFASDSEEAEAWHEYQKNEESK
jgi:predicted DNA-binding transcriptional regulator AlpA